MKATNDAMSTTTAEVEMKNALNDVKRAEGGKENPTGEIEFEAAAAQQEAEAEAEAAKAANEVQEANEVEGTQANHIENNATDEPASTSAPDNNQAEPNATTDATQATLNDLDKTKAPINNPPTEMQTYVSRTITVEFTILITY